MVGERAMEIVYSEVEIEENDWKYGTLGFSFVFYDWRNIILWSKKCYFTLGTWGSYKRKAILVFKYIYKDVYLSECHNRKNNRFNRLLKIISCDFFIIVALD